MSMSKQDNPTLNKTVTEEIPSLRCLILDGQRQSHGYRKIFSYHGIAQAVQYLRNMDHGYLIVCVPEWMKTHEELERLIELQNLRIIIMPFGTMGASIMDAPARVIDALIVTQLGLDSWSEPTKRILQFTFMKDSFMLPDDPWGKNGPSLSMLLRLKRPGEFSVLILVQLERFLNLLKDPPDLTLSKELRSDRGLLIIDGSNVAMSHGLNKFYSCLGIYLAFQYFWNDGYRKIIVCVPITIKISKYTVYDYKYLDMLYNLEVLTWTPSVCYDDRLLLNEAKKEKGCIVTNDQFKDFSQDWKDVKNACIRFEFDGNQFIAFPKGSEAVDKAPVVGEGSA